jgi:hypothetical protein
VRATAFKVAPAASFVSKSGSAFPIAESDCPLNAELGGVPILSSFSAKSSGGVFARLPFFSNGTIFAVTVVSTLLLGCSVCFFCNALRMLIIIQDSGIGIQDFGVQFEILNPKF